MSSDSADTGLHLEIQPHPVSQYLIRDRNTGDWSKKVFGWHGPVQLKWADKEVGAVVTALCKVEDRDGEGRENWARILLHGATALAQAASLSIFKANDVTDRLPSAQPTTTSSSISIADVYRQQLDRDHETHVLAQKSFKYAVKCLETYAEYPPQPGYASDGPVMYAYLRNCLAAADLGHMYSWYQEKMTGISSSMSELARRKNRNHEGFRRAQEYMRSNLFSFQAPDLWVQRPPTIDPQKMACG